MYRWTFWVSESLNMRKCRKFAVYEESYQEALEKVEKLFPFSRFYVADWGCEEVKEIGKRT